MLAALLLLLTAGPVAPVAPTWRPPSYSGIFEHALRQAFMNRVNAVPADQQPKDELTSNCWYARFILEYLKDPETLAFHGQYLTQKLHDEASEYDRDFCNGTGSPAWLTEMKASNDAKAKTTANRVRTSTAPPFSMPPMPDRAGGDLGAQLWTMFQALEVRLAKGGHVLKGDARACAWASAALAGAEAVQRTPAATSGIGAAVPVLDGKRTSTCRGDALAQKDAAWSWLRANPGATVPLEVARKAPVPAFPSSPGDPMLWVGAGLLFSVAPEAAPVLLLAR